jgi:hypothetical protein
VVGVTQPTAVVAGIAANRTMQEMLALANEMAQRIAYDTRDWTLLRQFNTFPGDGVLNPPPPVGNGLMVGTEAFNLPSDYKRLLISSSVWRNTDANRAMRFIVNTDDWLRRRMAGSTDAWGEWTMFGGQMHLWPIMPVGVSATFTYMNKNCVNLTSGGTGDSFVNDNDSFRLDERLLKLGMVWQWKANKGTSYAEDMGTFETAMAFAMGRDSPAPILAGRIREPYDARFW